ncbi:MAG: ABC transporter ATP-binding protein [Pseudomonadota bacterium]
MSVILNGVSKTFRANGVQTLVARDVSAEFPAGRCVALLGRNGAGKSSLLQMIAGVSQPDAGQIVRQGSVSWPVGFAGSFHGDLSGAENTRFVARIYGVDTDELVDYVADFSELGRQFNAPFRTYSSGMRSRLAFAVSMGVRFDTYLVDEVTAVGDARFRDKSEAVLQDRLASSGAIVVSHSLQMLARICDMGAVLTGGRLHWHTNVMDAIDQHREIMGVSPV